MKTTLLSQIVFAIAASIAPLDPHLPTFKVRTPDEWAGLDAHRASLRESRRLRRQQRKHKP